MIMDENRVLDALDAAYEAEEMAQREAMQGNEAELPMQESFEPILPCADASGTDANRVEDGAYAVLLASYEALQKEYETLKEDCRLQAHRSAQQAEFRVLYPEVDIDSLPDCVTNDPSLPLAAAYALYERKKAQSALQAQAQNEANLQKSSGAVRGAGAQDGIFSLDEIKEMSGKDIRTHYADVLRSLKKQR